MNDIIPDFYFHLIVLLYHTNIITRNIYICIYMEMSIKFFFFGRDVATVLSDHVENYRSKNTAEKRNL